MVGGRVAGRYAAAVVGAARERGRLTEVEDDLRRVAAALDEAPELGRVLAHPGLPRGSKAAVVAALFAGRVDSLTAELLRVAVLNGRAGHLPAIAAAGLALAERERGILPVEVETAAPLEPRRQAALEQALHRSAGRTPRVLWRREPSLIGGLVVRAGGRVIDASLRGRLARLEHLIKTLLN